MIERNTPRTRRIADEIYEDLYAEIMSGQLAPGDRLRQVDLAERFETSQTPVREAIARLASEGIVDLRPHRGAEVAKLSRREIREVYDLRLLLEPHAVGLTAELAGKEEAARIAALAEPDPSVTSELELFERNRRFHHALYEPCGNRRLVQILDSLWSSVTAVRMFELYAARPDEVAAMHDEHRAIAEAVAARNGTKASALLRAHLAVAQDELLALLGEE